MAKTNTILSGKSNVRDLFWSVAVPLTFFLIMLIFFPFRGVFTFDTDEGFNVMKAMLVVKGFPLYTETWSDQPPLFTHALAAIFRIVGFEVNAGRIYVLLLSSALIWAAFAFLQQVWSKWHGLAGAFLIVMLPNYLNLSVSNMVGLPALAFAMLSLLALATWHQQHKRVWLVFSAIALGISILTKIFTGFLIPIFLIGLVIGEYKRYRAAKGWIRLLYPAILWGGFLVGFTLLLGLILVGAGNLSQLVVPHLIASSNSLRNVGFDSLPIEWHLQEAWAILILAIVGSLIAIFKRSWLSFYLIAWMGVSYLLLGNYAPVWYHHQLIITIPAAMLAGIMVGEAAIAIFILKRPITLPTVLKWLLTTGTMIFLVVLFIRIPATVRAFIQQTNKRFTEAGTLSVDERFLKRMSTHAEETNWVFTDLPIYAFRAGLTVPPKFAVISAKRVLTVTLTEEQILAMLQEWQPEQVLLGRFEYPTIEIYLENHYNLLFSMEDKRLFLRNDL